MSDDGLKQVNKLSKKIPELGNREKPASRLTKQWTDKMCLIEGQKYCVWKRIPENEVEAHLINFANLWFGRGSKSSDKICSIIRNVLLLTPLGISNDLLLRDVLGSAIKTADTPPVIGKDIILKEPVLTYHNPKEKANVLAFHKWLKGNFALLKMEAKTTSKGQPHSVKYNFASQKLRAVIGFCALLLMRLRTKNIRQFKHYFPYPTSKTFDELFPEARLNVVLVEPEPKFLALASSVLQNDSAHNSLLYLLVFQYLKSTIQDDRSSKLAREILEGGCLEVLAGNGMGLVTLFQDVKQLYPNIDEKKLLLTIANHKDDEESLKRLDKFLNTYILSDKPQCSWKWARILSKYCFINMNIKQNHFLCCKFAALIVDKTPDIFKHEDLKTKDGHVDFAIKWAKSAKSVLTALNKLSDH